MSPSKIEGLDDIDSTYESVKSLDSFFQRKSYDEIKKLMDVHFFGKEETQTATASIQEDEDEDDIDIETASTESSSSLSDEDQKMHDILKDL